MPKQRRCDYKSFRIVEVKQDPYLVPEDRKLPLLASEAKEVKNYSVHHPIRQSILLV